MISGRQSDGSYLFYEYIERYDSLFKRVYYGYSRVAATKKFREELLLEKKLLRDNNK
jgi:hypothetical protein|tara:strand:- start:3079 stop:3249 length:171 start_codon:yes stop_codon:yes gene_type:complete